jgi:hypothetical protein
MHPKKTCRFLGEFLVCHGNADVDKPLLREAHPEELELVVVGYLVPPVIDKSSGAVLDIIGTTGAMCRLLPRAIDRRRRIFALRHVLRRRIVVIVDFDPLLPELLDFLPR